MKSHQHIAKALGQKPLADALGVGVTAVNNSLSRDHFPAAWYPVIRDLCTEKGVECPEEAFNFKSPRGAGDSARHVGPHNVEGVRPSVKDDAA